MARLSTTAWLRTTTLEVEREDGAPRLRAERQPDRSYIIRELH